MEPNVWRNDNHLEPTVAGIGPTGARRGLDLTTPTSGRLVISVTPGRHMRKGGKVQHFQSGKAQYRTVRPATGKGDWAEGDDRSGYGGPIREAMNVAATKAEREMLIELSEAGAKRRMVAKRHLVTLDRYASGWTGKRENRPARIAALIREAQDTGHWN